MGESVVVADVTESFVQLLRVLSLLLNTAASAVSHVGAGMVHICFSLFSISHEMLDTRFLFWRIRATSFALTW